MEIGGVERSLLGLLDSIDYAQCDVDLFLLSHTGEFMPLINKNVNLLPESKMFSLVSWPITNLITSGHFYMACIRMWSKFYGAVRAKVTKTESLNITICKKIVSRKTKRLKVTYDLALGFFAPHYFLEERVDAKVKIGWVHTDYSNITELPDVIYTLPMWEKLDYIACVSEKVKASFDSVYPALKSKTIVAENILSDVLVRKQAESCDVSGEMPQGDFIKILSVGRFCTAKAFDEIPAACKELVSRGYKLKWYLIGYGPDEELIRQKIHECHMEDHVIILGKKDNPYPYMKTCDIYVQPSRYEGKAVTVVEAQILNKPVMITRYATSASQVQEGIDGFICEMGSEGIVDGLGYLIDHPEICRTLAENTKRNNYCNENEIEQLLELLPNGGRA